MKKQHWLLVRSLVVLCMAASSDQLVFADASDAKAGKTFIDYFLPTPIIGSLSKDAWGTASVGPRDQKNGLEDPTLAQWDYWDGRIIKSPDGKYHLFGSRWNQAKGHSKPLTPHTPPQNQISYQQVKTAFG